MFDSYDEWITKNKDWFDSVLRENLEIMVVGILCWAILLFFCFTISSM